MMTDGWTKTDVIYVWDDSSALQLAPNMSLPGGFKLGMFGSDYCDVITNTGQYSCLQVISKHTTKSLSLSIIPR